MIEDGSKCRTSPYLHGGGARKTLNQQGLKRKWPLGSSRSQRDRTPARNLLTLALASSYAAAGLCSDKQGSIALHLEQVRQSGPCFARVF